MIADISDAAKSVKSFALDKQETISSNQAYLQCGNLQVKELDRGFAWLDIGHTKSCLLYILRRSSKFIKPTKLSSEKGLHIINVG